MTKKKRFLLILLAALALVALATFEAQTRVARGWVAGEAFYAGRPTSWWSAELPCWQEFAGGCTFPPWRKFCGWQRQPSSAQTWVGRCLPRWRPPGTFEQPRLLTAQDPAAVPVLIQLLGDADPSNRRKAVYGLWQLEEQARPAAPALVRLLTDADEELGIRLDAWRALVLIDPGAAAKAGMP